MTAPLNRVTPPAGSSPPVEDPAREYREQLPAHIRSQIHDTQRVVVLVNAAWRRGWTVAALVTESTRDLAGVYKPGGVITHRLEHCAEHDPPTKPPKQRPEWCTRCDPTTRQTLDDNHLPSGRRCTDCHPLNRKAAR